MSSMVQVSINEIEQNLPAYLRRVETGETIVIVKAGKAIAEIKPIVSNSKRLRPFGLCAVMICPGCNSENPANASFCMSCGTKLENLVLRIISLAHLNKPYELVNEKWQWNSIRGKEIENLCKGTKYEKRNFQVAKTIIRATMPQFKRIYAELGIDFREDISFIQYVGASYNKVTAPITDEEKISKDIAIVWKLYKFSKNKLFENAWWMLSNDEREYLAKYNISLDVIEKLLSQTRTSYNQKRIQKCLELLNPSKRSWPKR